MNRDQVLAALCRHRQDIEQHFAMKHLSVFGSAARDELRDDSDIDVLVEFKGKATFDGSMDLKSYLETLLGRNVDLVTHDAVQPRMRPMISIVLRRVQQSFSHCFIQDYKSPISPRYKQSTPFFPSQDFITWPFPPYLQRPNLSYPLRGLGLFQIP